MVSSNIITKMQNSSTGKVYQVFYSKDVRKKKKVYSDGILVCEDRKTKLFTSEGECVLKLNSKSDPILDEEYTINNSYVVLVEKELSYENFLNGRVFIETKVVPVNLVKKPQKKKSPLHKIQNEIAKQYPSGLKIQAFIYPSLRQHQVQGVSFMYDCVTGKKGGKIEGCILADFMGLGKTLQTLTLIRCLLIDKKVNKVMVVCPLTLIKVWEKQCSKWMGSKLNPLIAFGSSEEVAKVFRMFTEYEYRFLIASYQQFYKFSDKLSAKCDLLVFDEGHRLKNKKSKLIKKILTFKCKKRILLTGTPIQNNLDQLYTCIMLVNPSFFESEAVFKNVFQKPILSGMAKCANKEQRALALSRTAELASLIKQFSLRRKADVLQTYLPKKREYQIFLKLTPTQLSLYEKILKRKINDTQVLSYLNQMRKLFTHPLLFKTDRFDNHQWKDCHEDCREEKSYKMEFVLKVALECKETQEKVVIVSYFTETLDFIQSILNQHDITSSKLDGRLEGKDRFKTIENFFRNKTVLLLSGKAGGTGLTLTCASKMILIEPDWNPSNDSQVMGRVWRQGQTKQVQIFRLMIGCSFEEKILQRQQLKQNLSEKLIDEQKSTKSYDFFSMKQLFMQIEPKCITYQKNQNRLSECEEEINYIDWSNCVFVNTIESHQDVKKELENEFQEAQFDDIQEKNKQNEDDDIIEDDFDFIQLGEDFKDKKSDKKDFLEIVENSSKKRAKKHEERVNQQKEDTCQTFLAQQDEIPENSLPLALRKMKKKGVKKELLKIPSNE